MSHVIALALVAGVAATPERLAADLGGPQFAAREAASARLWRAGEIARPALVAAARSADPEAARRAADLLDRFDWGLYADTAPAVRKLVLQFRSGGEADQDAALAALVRADELPTVRKLLARPRPADERYRLAESLVALLRRDVPPLIAAGEKDKAGARLALHGYLADLPGLLDLTVFEHLRGKPEPTAPQSPLLDVCRKHAAGDRAGALQAAAPFPREQAALLEDAGDWTALADRPIGRANSGDGLKAFRLRRAGRAAEAAAILDEQPDLPLGAPRGSAAALDEPTLALVLNDRAAAAVARLTERQYAPHILADWLTAQLRFADALDLVRPDRKRREEFDDTFYRGLAGTRRGRVLSMLGRKAEATAAFEDAFKVVRGGVVSERLWQQSGGYGLEQLVRAEVRAGRHDLACAHLGAVLDLDELDRKPIPDKRGGAFEALFEVDAEVGPALLGIVGRGDPAGDRLRRVRALLAGKGTADDLEAVTAFKRPDPASEPDRARVVGQAVGAVLRAAGKLDEAAKVFAEVADHLPPAADDPPLAPPEAPPGAKSWVYRCDERIRFWVEFGDVLTALGRHADAAARLHQGWLRFPDSSTLLFLSGRALAKAGRAAEGKARMDAAHWVPLGNPGPRGRLMEELLARGLVAEADRERSLAGLAGWAGGANVGNVWSQAAKVALVAGRFPDAAALYDRNLHYVLKTDGVHYIDGSAYLTVPQSAAVARARALLAAGKPDEAAAAAEACLDVLPSNTELAIALVGGLDAAGRGAAADGLFRKAWDAFGAVIEAHPESAWARAEAAWLAAGCRRELDRALEFATAAVERDPDGFATRRALAEVRFRRGDRAGAAAVMATLVADDRLSHLYRRQLERYKSAPLDAPPPDVDDD